MARKRQVLILGGTAEAVALAEALAGDPAIAAVYSLAGRTDAPRLPAGTAVRTGGFGGAAALADWLDTREIAAVVDATHPFADRIAANAAAACQHAGVPRLKLLRPAWTPVEGDNWTVTDTVETAADHLAPGGGTVFLSIGRQELAAFNGHQGRKFLIRTVDPIADPPLADAICIIGRGPFSLAEETGLLRRHRVDILIAKNAGGDATYAKIAAARALKLPVIMVDRRAPPAGPQTCTVEGALHWLDETPGREETVG